MATTKLTIDPKRFTSSQWEELYYVDGGELLGTDRHYRATPVVVGKKKVVALAAACRAKIDSIIDGELAGEDEPGQDAEWTSDLEGAAEILEKLAGVKAPAKHVKSIVLRPRELATVLAALRTWQACGGGKITCIGGVQLRAIHDIATEAGDPLTADEIDNLCERINTSEVTE